MFQRTMVALVFAGLIGTTTFISMGQGKNSLPKALSDLPLNENVATDKTAQTFFNESLFQRGGPSNHREPEELK